MRRVLRKIAVPLVVALSLAGVVTAVANASSLGTAAFVKGASVFPGDGREFSVKITNASTGLLAVGEQIDFVKIILPSADGVRAAGGLTGPAGWTGSTVTTPAGLHEVRFRASGSPLSPGSNAVFGYLADVAAPESGDAEVATKVFVSSDGGRTFDGANTLTTTVAVLEVTSLSALAPAGVTDQVASAGQDITYGVTVRSYARQALTVTAKLASSQSGDEIGTAAPVSIASGARETVEFPVTLGAFSSGSTVSTFIADATSENAHAEEFSARLDVQAPPTLKLDADSLRPSIVRSGTPVEYTFAVAATKTQKPTLQLSNCSLSFAGTTASLAEPARFSTGTVTKTLAFAPVAVTGAEGVHSARITCSGTDGNDHPVSYQQNLTDVITVDNTAPAVTVGVGIPKGQTAVKSGDALTLSGTVGENADLDFVRLRTNLGQTFECEPSSTQKFSCAVSPEFTPGTTEAWAEAQATDAAGNIGGAVSDVIAVDLTAPKLVLARTESLERVLVRFDEPDGVIRGGCDPTQWTVNGHLVSQVLFSNGDTCTSPPAARGKSGPSGDPNNFRVLVLADALSNLDETPEVRYARSSHDVLGDDVRDAAANLAATATVKAVPGILPPAPEITEVTRTDSAGSGEREAATADGAGTKPATATYWTNRTGNDLQVGFSGGRTGYRVQVVSANGTALTDPQEITSASGGGTVSVPVGSTDDRYVRGIRLINAAGAGAITYFDVALDRTAPALSGAAAEGEKQVTVTFTEVIAFGSDFANDWYTWRKAGGGRDYYAVERVDVTADRTERLLTVPFTVDSSFGGVDYLFTSDGPGARRYEDRAGNQLADSLP